MMRHTALKHLAIIIEYKHAYYGGDNEMETYIRKVRPVIMSDVKSHLSYKIEIKTEPRSVCTLHTTDIPVI